jgi:hypothetical protein
VPESRIELTGWKAVAGLGVFLAIAGVRLAMRLPAIQDDGRETVRAWFVQDYEGRGPKAMAQMVSDYRAGLPVHAPEPPVVPPKVEFVLLAAHGSRDVMVVRAEVTVDGGPPPDDRSVRYIYLTTKFGGGWMVMSETNAFSYYEALVR